MSAESTIITAEHLQYIRQHTVQEDHFLRDLKEAARRAGMPEICIAPEQAALMHVLLKLIGAKEVVEIGTLAGYSAICMARALPPGGQVRTIEISGSYADFAESWIAKSDVAGMVKVLRGQASQMLPKQKEGSADAAFIDADKANYPLYLRECLRIVRRGGLVMADNAFAFGALLDGSNSEPDVQAIRSFNELMTCEKTLTSIIAPLGDGCWVGVKS